MKKPVINITEKALSHFGKLIEKEEVDNMALRVFLDHPGLPTAEVGISFCPPGEEKEADMKLVYDAFALFVDGPSAPYLEDAFIDFEQDDMGGGQLSIKAPHLKGSKPETNAPIYERVQYIINSDINPGLASHGGMVQLVEITDDNVAVLQFGGGCQGCGMVDVTLKQGIERTLLAEIPELSAVRDATDHASGENPYY